MCFLTSIVIWKSIYIYIYIYICFLNVFFFLNYFSWYLLIYLLVLFNVFPNVAILWCHLKMKKNSQCPLTLLNMLPNIIVVLCCPLLALVIQFPSMTSPNIFLGVTPFFYCSYYPFIPYHFLVIPSLFSLFLIVLSSFHYFLMFSHNTSWHLFIVLNISQTWMWCPLN